MTTTTSTEPVVANPDNPLAVYGDRFQARQRKAVDGFVQMTLATGPGPWDHFTCDEVEAVIELLNAFGYTGAAEYVLDEHSDGDDSPEDEHHEHYLLNHPLPESGTHLEEAATIASQALDPVIVMDGPDQVEASEPLIPTSAPLGSDSQ